MVHCGFASFEECLNCNIFYISLETRHSHSRNITVLLLLYVKFISLKVNAATNVILARYPSSYPAYSGF